MNTPATTPSASVRDLIAAHLLLDHGIYVPPQLAWEQVRERHGQVHGDDDGRAA